ncbi:PSD1 and planctomycete cytochrome C domain-containing protein [Akkermansiaceae bacterium]|nr:PSD1 and planctomycete cytochrome C domain-containing protein [Akkermansiaceae bacterium]
MLFLSGLSSSALGSEFDFFESKIRPVLAANCYECHSVDAANRGKLKGGLFLDTRDGMRKGGDTAAAVVPGNIEESLLLKALHQEDFEMPPKGKLADEVIADFTQWIETGALDPRDQAAVELKKTIIDASDHWAFQIPRKPNLPAVNNQEWEQSPIDRFILHRLEGEQLSPVSPAPPRVLVRRLYFNLLGLPPTPKQVQAFLEDAGQDRDSAVARLVEELLESPHYGERWGRHWLDVARYAEDQAHTFGVKKRESAHQYRDWVIRMFNEDLPFDEFIKLQLAGDLMADKPEDRFRQFSGLGFLGLGAQYYKNSDKAQAEADELDDTIDTLTRGFLGLTVSCARCHDHKFDPIPTADYYALAGIFNGRRYAEIPLAAEDEVKAYNDEQKIIKELEGSHRSYLKGLGKEEGRKNLNQVSRHLQEAWRLISLRSKGVKISDDEFAGAVGLHPHYVRRFREVLEKGRKSDLMKYFPELEGWHGIEVSHEGMPTLESLKAPREIVELADQLQVLVSRAEEGFSRIEIENAEELAKARDTEDRLNKVMGKMENEQKRLLKNIWYDGHAPLYVSEKDVYEKLLNEDQKAKADLMKAEFEALRKKAKPKYPVAHGIQGGGQAMQVYIRGNPASKGEWVARGSLGILDEQARPTDPEEVKKHSYTRLDLARSIASPKNPLTARVIVNRVWQWHFGKGLVTTSSNFGMLGESPTHPELLDWLTVNFMENGWSLKWLHREILNSATYQLSSERNSLDEERDPENVFRWRFDRRRLDVEAWRDALLAISGRLDPEMGGPTFDLKSNTPRRTVYAGISRHELDGMLRIFDFPDANVSSAARTETTVPQQQLFVLNSDFIIEQAKAFAKLVTQEHDEIAGKVEFAYQVAFGRSVSEGELALATAYLGQEKGKDDKLSRWEQYCQALLASNELMYID